MGAFKMTVMIAIFCCVLGLHAMPTPDEEKYSDKYDDIDYKSILNSKRLLNSYTKCLLDEGPCTAEGKDLREQLPDILQTKCKKCTEKQKKGSLDIIEILQKEHKDSWDILEKRWDPESKLVEPLLAYLRHEQA